MKRFLIGLFFFPTFLSAQVESSDVIDFLEKSSLKTDSTVIIENVKQFLDADIKKGVLSWFEGKLLSSDGQNLEGLKLNFNAFNNSIYALQDGIVYKISNSAIKEFQISKGEKWRLFKKGYGIPFNANIVAQSNATIQEIMLYLTDYPEYKSVRLNEVNFLSHEDDEQKITIEFKAGFKSDVSSLKKYIEKYDGVTSVISEYTASEIGVNIYMEVLCQNQYFEVIKYNYKRSSVSESVGIVNSTSQLMLDEKDYYFATEKLLTPLFLGRKSIRKALSSLGLETDKKIKGLGNEKKLVKWCISNRFRHIQSE